MIIPVDVTIEQLRSMTKTQIITKLSSWLTNNFTKHQLILWLLDRDVLHDDSIITYNANNQLISQTEIERDIETGLQIRKIITRWAYYAEGEVNVISIKNYDANNTLMNTTTIKHYRDGRQPETVIK